MSRLSILSGAGKQRLSTTSSRRGSFTQRVRESFSKRLSEQSKTQEFNYGLKQSDLILGEAYETLVSCPLYEEESFSRHLCNLATGSKFRLEGIGSDRRVKVFIVSPSSAKGNQSGWISWADEKDKTQIRHVPEERKSETQKVQFRAEQTNTACKFLSAAERGDTQECFDLLHKKGGIKKMIGIRKDVDVNENDMYGQTALILACGHAHADLVSMLLCEDGINLDACDHNHSRVALHHVLFISSQASDRELATRMNIMTILIGAKACIDVSDEDGLTPLMLVARQGRLEMVTKLVQAKANLNIMDNQERTALAYAQYASHNKVEAFLLSNGAIDTMSQLVQAKAQLAQIDEECKAEESTGTRAGFADNDENEQFEYEEEEEEDEPELLGKAKTEPAGKAKTGGAKAKAKGKAKAKAGKAKTEAKAKAKGKAKAKAKGKGQNEKAVVKATSQDSTQDSVQEFDVEDIDLIKPLGEGAAGEAWQGTADIRGQKVSCAIKLFPNNEGDAFEQELKVFRVLHNKPNICKMHGYFMMGDKPGLVLELLCPFEFQGLQDPRFSTHDLLQAMKVCHTNGVCHLDIKPGNIMMCPATNRIKLIDFSVSKVNAPVSSGVIGTLPFAAPEVLLPDPWDGFCADMFSIGIVVALIFDMQCLFEHTSWAATLSEDEDWPAVSRQFGESVEALVGDLVARIDRGAALLAMSLLDLDPKERITVDQALELPWFEGL